MRTVDVPAGGESGTPRPFSTFVEGRRGQILDAALEVFGQKGYAAGTMREIAKIVGVSEPALYRHYVGKEALLVDLVEVAGARVAELATGALAAVDGGADVGEALSSLMTRRETVVSNYAFLMRAVMGAAQYNDAAREAFRRVTGQPVTLAVRALVARVDGQLGIKRSAEETEAKARGMMSMLVGVHLTAQFFDAPSSNDEVIASLTSMMGW